MGHLRLARIIEESARLGMDSLLTCPLLPPPNGNVNALWVQLDSVANPSRSIGGQKGGSRSEGPGGMTGQTGSSPEVPAK
jgi:hypothetical protein